MTVAGVWLVDPSVGSSREELHRDGHHVGVTVVPQHVYLAAAGIDAEKTSDSLTPRELHRTRLYHLVLKPCGIEDTAYLRLRVPPPARPKVVTFARGRDFRARDCAVLDALSPHLGQLHHGWALRRRLRGALELHESTQAAVVLLEADDQIAFASTAARKLLHRYFGETRTCLPERVAAWQREQRQNTTGEPLQIETVDRALVVEFVDDGLLLEEQRPVPPLTRRERDVLELVAQGKSNAEIAERLWISRGTVRKHLDNIYAKLGVHTRTAAASFVSERQREPC